MDRVLIVEDNMAIQSLVENFLRSEHGLVVFTADDGKEALSLCESKFIDLVLTDNSMPEMTGIELIAKLRESFPEIKTALMTSDVFDEDDLKLIGCGAYIHKPFDLIELGDRIVELLKK